MTGPQRIRLSRARGFRLPENAVVVARPSRWGNPFVVGKHGTRAQCAAKYYVLARGFIAFSEPDLTPETQVAVYRQIQDHQHELGGKDLACWCALDGGACHADVLLTFANPGHPAPPWLIAGVDLPRVRLGMSVDDFEKMRDKAALKAKLG